jgi:alpha-tubulin suppressor-like RCC1 family protein
MAGHHTSDVVCGYNHTLIQMGDRKVFGFGCNQLGQLAATSITVAEPLAISIICERIFAGGNQSFFT